MELAIANWLICSPRTLSEPGTRFWAPLLCTIIPIRYGNLWKGLLATLCFVLSGCGGGSSVLPEGFLSNAHSGFSFTDTNGNAISFFSDGATIQLRDSSDRVLVSFSPDGDVDFTNVTAARTGTRSLLHFPSTADKNGIAGNITFHVPCAASDDLVVLCPDAEATDDVASGCDSELNLTDSSPSSAGYLWDNPERSGSDDCEVIVAIEDFGTGGMGDAVDTGDDDDNDSSGDDDDDDDSDGSDESFFGSGSGFFSMITSDFSKGIVAAVELPDPQQGPRLARFSQALHRVSRLWGRPVLKSWQKYHQKVLAEYAPVFVQRIGRQPRYDAITRFDYDGNLSGYDNVKNAKKFPLPATVYGDVVAETVDSYYLFYGVYHLRDYDTPIREFFFKASAHDNDFEGAMLVVDKTSGQVRAAEGWWHNKFLQAAPTLSGVNEKVIDGKLHFEGGTHAILYVQSRGHGVRAFQKLDEQRAFKKDKFQIYRLGKESTDLAQSKSAFASYQLRSLADFVRHASGPFDKNSMLAGPQYFGVGKNPLGKYLSGNFNGNSSWARPKPPWSWVDKFDSFRPGAWFFHPAYVLNKRIGLNVSEEYLYNLAAEKVLAVSYQDLDRWLEAEAPSLKSYWNDIPKGPLHRPLKKLRKRLYIWVEYLFYVFG